MAEISGDPGTRGSPHDVPNAGDQPADKAGELTKDKPKTRSKSKDSSSKKPDTGKGKATKNQGHVVPKRKSFAFVPPAANSFGFVPAAASTPLATPPGRIPLKTTSDKRLDRLEAMMTTQFDRNEEFKETIMSALSVEQMPRTPDNYDAQGEVYDEPEGYDEGTEEEEGYPFNQYHTMSDEEEDIDMAEDGEQPGPSSNSNPGQTEVLPEAVSNVVPVKKTDTTASGFAVKFAMTTVGENIDPVIATSMQYLMTNKLAEKALTEMLDKYETPANARAMCVPKVNAPIWDSLKAHTRNVDLKLQKIHKLVMKGTIAMTKGKSDMNEDEQNSLTCLAAANFEMNMMRRDLIRPGLQEKFALLCKPTVPVTENLFGDDLSKNIKDLDEVHKATGRMARYQGGRQGGQRYQTYHNNRGNYRGRGRGGQQYNTSFNSSFLGRGSPNRQQQGYRNRLLSARRGRGRGAGRGQPQQQ